MSYAVHRLPETPSESLNSWLKSRYSVSSNVVQHVIGTVICAFFEAASNLHRALLRAHSSVEAKPAWMAACGLLGLAVAIAAWLAFNLIMASSFIVYNLLHYAAVLTGLAGIGLGATGAFYFNKDVDSTGHGDSAGTKKHD